MMSDGYFMLPRAPIYNIGDEIEIWVIRHHGTEDGEKLIATVMLPEPPYYSVTGIIVEGKLTKESFECSFYYDIEKLVPGHGLVSWTAISEKDIFKTLEEAEKFVEEFNR